MHVDYGNALDAVATPGVSEPALGRLDGRVGRAHDRIAAGMAADEFGYASLTLPERTDAAAIERAAGAVTGAVEADRVLTVGIGGSALGAATVSRALGAGPDEHAVLDNVDPAATRALLADLPLDRTAVNVVSRSGTTAETLANFLVVRDALAERGLDWTERTVVTTGETGPLRALADEHGLPVLDVPPAAPGRFAALSPVGLLPAAILGYDVERVLAGGRASLATLSDSLFECPAYAYGAVATALERRGVHVNAVMPYAEALEPFAEWTAQLWAESLGKDGQGQTPARALGATDQHSQLQGYRAGRPDTLVTLVRPRERPDVPIPDPGTDLGGIAYLGGSSLGELIDAEFAATEASLAAAGRPNIRVGIDRVDARGIGDLLHGLEAACVLAGELMGVETFTQPAVEWGKRAARGLLGGGEFPEADAVRGKTTRRVGPDGGDEDEDDAGAGRRAEDER